MPAPGAIGSGPVRCGVLWRLRHGAEGEGPGIFVNKGVMSGLLALGALLFGVLLVAYADGGREARRQITRPVAVPAQMAGPALIAMGRPAA